MWDAKIEYLKYAVKCRSFKLFLDTYYKHDRYKGRGETYAKALYNSHLESLEKDGFDIISRHDSNTGRVVAFYSKKGGSK